MRVVSLILGIVCLGFAFNASAKPLFMGLGDLPGGDFYSRAYAVSADGSVVVGMGVTDSGIEAFRWTQGSGMVGLGDLPGGDFTSSAAAVSADGSVVVGRRYSASSGEAFRWTQGSGMVGLGDLPGGGAVSSKALAVSADGSVVVGYGKSASGREAFRRYWTTIFAGGYTYVVSVLEGLGDLPGGDFDSRAYAVSADGSVVVGSSASASGGEAFRWTQGGGMVGLGDLPGGNFSSKALAVSAGGSVVVGGSNSASGYEAFIWDSTHGMREVDEVLTALGADLTGWTLESADGISADGLTLVGWGTNPDGNQEAWIANLPCDLCEVDPIVDPSDQDGDKVADPSDNCPEDPNPDQVDTDGDGYGNLCDADYDGDGVVGGRDFLLFRSTFGKRASQRGFLAAADADGDGVIAGTDFLAFRAQYQRGAPGP